MKELLDMTEHGPGQEPAEIFTPAIRPEELSTDPESPVAETQILESYVHYQQARDQLHTAEQQGRKQDAGQLLGAVLEQKERLAAQVSELYRQSTSLSEFEQRIEALLQSKPMQQDALQMGTDEAAVGAYMLPASTEDEHIPSPVEAIRGTIENLKIIDRFATVGERHASGLLVSGSNTWGAHYAVRGGIPRELQEAGFDQLSYKEISDVDLLVTAPDVDGLSQVVQDYVEAGLLQPAEAERFAVFKNLYEGGKVDMFSVREHAEAPEKSIHFIPQDKVDKLASLERLNPDPRGEYALDYIRDFRPNYREGDYQIGDLKGLTKTSFMPTSQEVRYPHQDEVAGYIYDLPVGGPAEVEGEETYFIGLVPFFFLVTPTVYVDKDGELSSRIAEFQGNVQAVMGGDEIQWMPRQERMPSYIHDKVKGELS